MSLIGAPLFSRGWFPDAADSARLSTIDEALEELMRLGQIEAAMRSQSAIPKFRLLITSVYIMQNETTVGGKVISSAKMNASLRVAVLWVSLLFSR